MKKIDRNKLHTAVRQLSLAIEFIDNITKWNRDDGPLNVKEMDYFIALLTKLELKRHKWQEELQVLDDHTRR
jgi:hypothetical protein